VVSFGEEKPKRTQESLTQRRRERRGREEGRKRDGNTEFTESGTQRAQRRVRKKAKFENGNLKNESSDKGMRLCRDPSTPCRKERGTPVGMTSKRCRI
jgi:hypothetical protein